MVDVDVVGSMSDIVQDAVIGSCESIGPLHGHVVPVCPVHPLLKHRDGERMGYSVFQNHVSVGAIHIGKSGQAK